MKPVSYVAPSAQASGTSPQRVWQVPTLQDAEAIRQARERSKRNARIVTAIVLLIFAFIIYQIYGFFLRQAVAYSGYYWNNHQGFALTLPGKGWSHCRASDLNSLLIKDPADAFYMGKNSRKPEVLVTFWNEYSGDVYSNDYVEANQDTLIAKAEEAVCARLSDFSSCEFSESKNIALASERALLLRGTAKKGNQAFRLIVYCGFHEHFLYFIPFLGKLEKMDQEEKNIQTIMDSFTYRSTLI